MVRIWGVWGSRSVKVVSGGLFRYRQSRLASPSQNHHLHLFPPSTLPNQSKASHPASSERNTGTKGRSEELEPEGQLHSKFLVSKSSVNGEPDLSDEFLHVFEPSTAWSAHKPLFSSLFFFRSFSRLRAGESFFFCMFGFLSLYLYDKYVIFFSCMACYMVSFRVS